MKSLQSVLTLQIKTKEMKKVRFFLDTLCNKIDKKLLKSVLSQPLRSFICNPCMEHRKNWYMDYTNNIFKVPITNDYKLKIGEFKLYLNT